MGRERQEGEKDKGERRAKEREGQRREKGWGREKVWQLRGGKWVGLCIYGKQKSDTVAMGMHII